MYHSVQAREGRGRRRERYTIDQKRLARQLILLRVLRYRVLALDELIGHWLNGQLPPPRSLAITFDDGYQDAAEHAWPVLRRLGCPATLFVPSGMVGGTASWEASNDRQARPLLNWNGLADLDRQGFRVEAHGVNHLDLTAVELEVAEREIRGSREQIQQHLGRPAMLFAYPYGRSNSEVRKLVEIAQYDAAVTAKVGLNTPRTDRFALKRVEIWGTDSLAVFAMKIVVGDNPLRYLRRRTGTR